MAFAKHIFVTGGVTSSLGKGIIASSLAKLLQAGGFSVTIQKFDPYINVDPGTLNPYEHGECYVTDDGAETDLDLGHYERFLNVPTSQANNVTTGRIYYNVITKEREGAYLGKTVQVVPHITDEIKNNFLKLDKTGKYDIIITEIGGCVGDIESLPFIEAVRQFRWDLGSGNSLVVHLTLVPYLKSAGELKTKPSQHSVKQLSEAGIQPDILVCRAEQEIPYEIRKKLALFCNVDFDCVIEALDADTIYAVPLLMQKEKLDERVLQKLQLVPKRQPNMESWKQFLQQLRHPAKNVRIGLIGKYVELHDAYKSIVEAFIHAGAVNNCKVDIVWVQSESLEDDPSAQLAALDLSAILVAPGFGQRGIEGKIGAVRYARENKIPFLGICLGMQCAVVEYARNVLGWADAASREMNPDTTHAVIDLMEDQHNLKNMGGTMRLGAYACELAPESKAYSVYDKPVIRERHRHRYEFNNQYLADFERAGMKAVGKNPDTTLVEIVEIAEHPWFIGVQYHPELRSTVESPHPLFVSFVRAALAYAGHNVSEPIETT
ncbi:CTP synthase [Eisenibacter elegans]|jgi:CTP synthase|uniref:CTP synthase n=1 Tax=Eisenibacter elegans TaxID=997 RepID=UPI000411F0CE|nr:CTP synthase [Eisenibacter elegans]